MVPWIGNIYTGHFLGSGGTGTVGGWKELGRTTLGSANANITVSSLADKRYLMILGDYRLTGAGTGGGFRVGNGSVDSGSNYAFRTSTNGGVDGTSINQDHMNNIGGFSNTPEFFVSYLANYSTKEKLGQIWRNYGLTGVGNAPNRYESVGKWTNTSNVIERVNAYQGGTDTYNTGSEVVVLGFDPADTHTDNFWEELASVDWSTGTSFNTGTFTAKKYLWIQFYIKGTSADLNGLVTFNSDTGNNYVRRGSINGGADSTSTSRANIDTGLSATQGMEFVNMFIINNSANEKLIIFHTVGRNTAGAGTAPQRKEGVGKWVTTGSQITSININGNSTLTAGKIKVWGHD